MHERYLFPAIALLFMAWAVRRDARILIALALSGAAMFVNTGIVLDNSIRLGSALGHLNSDTQGLANGLAVLNLASLIPLLGAALDACLSPEREVRLRLPFGLKLREAEPVPVTAFRTDAGLHWSRRDTAILAAITLVYSAVALWNLGSTKAPQTAWTSTGYDEQVVDASSQVVGIAHADCEKDADLLATLLMRNHPPKEILTVMYEPVTGSHVGPGTLALFFLGDADVRSK